MTAHSSLPTAPRIVGLIPARLAATRLPGKPLRDLCGKPLVQHVWERASRTRGLHAVAIATPDREIIEAAVAFGAQTVETRAEHRTGTDRLAEAARLLALQDSDIVVNIQGDEPMIRPEEIALAFAPLCTEQDLVMTSLMCACSPEDHANPACVKVVCALNGDALYFSRARVPAPYRVSGQAAETNVMQHIGLYAYRAGFLQLFAGLPQTPLERAESLEQLRVLEHGFRIRMVRVDTAPIGVDTPEDLERVRSILTGAA